MSPPCLLDAALRPLPYTPTMVRLVVPPGVIGAYLLLEAAGPGRVVYVGRSDSDLRRRLLTHPYRGLDYFVFRPCASEVEAYLTEARAYRLLQPLRNRVAPARPATLTGLGHDLLWPVPRLG